MKKFWSISLLSFFTLLVLFSTTHAETKTFTGSGEIISVDPLYSRITIKHGTIAGFAQEGETDFLVVSAELIKNLASRDIVDFKIQDTSGDAKIIEMTRTGQAEPKSPGLPIGEVTQRVLEGTGQVVKTVTAPITPVGEVVSGTIDATTGATDAVIGDKRSESATKF